MDDDALWFVRRLRPSGYTINPCRWQGWAVIAAYVIVALAITPLADRGQWLAWSVLLATATFLFVLTAWRHSAPAPREK